jgi:ribonuclease P protein component
VKFTARDRLSNQQEFKNVAKGRLRSQGRQVLLIARANGLSHARLGLGVAKRQIRKATARNRIKRLIRESFRYHKAMLTGLDVLAIPFTAAEQLSGRELLGILAGQWQRLAQGKCSAS